MSLRYDSQKPHAVNSSAGGNPFQSIWNGITSAAAAIAAAALKAFGAIPDEKPAPLGGHSVIFTNLVFCGIAAGILLCIGLGLLVDRTWPKLFGRGHPSGWVVFWLVSSYALLVPGIICILFSFNIFASFTILGTAHVRYNLTRDPQTGKPSSISESMVSFIDTLWTSGGRVGAVLVVTYAIVIPCTKVFLLILGEYWRNSTDERVVANSRRCILIVQMVSKWASPDMFAYILMLYLFRHMNHPPMLVATADLDIGFISFTMFCLNSTFASLAIPLPKLQQANMQSVAAATKDVDRDERQPYCLRYLGPLGVKIMTVFLAVAFFICWGLGIAWPCMSLKLVLETMNISPSIKKILYQLDFQKLINSKVSLWNCLYATASWLSQGEAATIIAFLLIAVFVIALPFMDVFILLISAFTQQPACPVSDVSEIQFVPENLSDEKAEKRSPNVLMKISHYVNHIAMLDVFVMGIVVICAAGASYSSKGILIRLEYGMYPLICAEVAHYTMYYLVSSLCVQNED